MRFPDLSVFVVPGSSVELCRQVATGALDAAIVVACGNAWRSTA